MAAQVNDVTLPLVPFVAGYGYKDEDLGGSAEKGVRWLHDRLAGAVIVLDEG